MVQFYPPDVAGGMVSSRDGLYKQGQPTDIEIEANIVSGSSGEGGNMNITTIDNSLPSAALAPIYRKVNVDQPIEMQASQFKSKNMNSLSRRTKTNSSTAKDSPISLKKIINKLERTEREEHLNSINKQQGIGALPSTQKSSRRNPAAISSFSSSKEGRFESHMRNSVSPTTGEINSVLYQKYHGKPPSYVPKPTKGNVPMSGSTSHIVSRNKHKTMKSTLNSDQTSNGIYEEGHPTFVSETQDHEVVSGGFLPSLAKPDGMGDTDPSNLKNYLNNHVRGKSVSG